MEEFLHSLEWPAAFAIVGSIVTIVTGLLGFWHRRGRTPSTVELQIISPEEHQDFLDRFDNIEEDLRSIHATLKSHQKQMQCHEQRDIEDFKTVDAKIDRLMDIIVRILEDERL